HLLEPIVFHHPTPDEISTLSLHDALPISHGGSFSGTDRARFGGHHVRHSARGHGDDLASPRPAASGRRGVPACPDVQAARGNGRSEEHTSELQSRFDLVCRLLLEKKKELS